MSEELKSKFEAIYRETPTIGNRKGMPTTCYISKDDILNMMQSAHDLKADEWVSVEVELPPLRENILIYSKYKSRITGKRFDDHYEVAMGEHREYDYVTHWQPLPTPPNQ